MSSVPLTDLAFKDILAEFRSQSDIGWALGSKDFPPPPASQGETPQKLMERVLNSEKVINIMDAEVGAREWPKDAVLAEARGIADEMAHDFRLGTLRGVGYVVHKAFQKIFSSINVNVDEVGRLREQSKERPIILMPTHKTYMDFLLMSYVCFNLHLTPPAIASATDFLGMKFVGEALRRCGAFFIRRSFGEDKLYWAIFTEYVQTLLQSGDRPLEFFLEATRSRTGKSLYPKVGLLTALLEPFLRREVYDILLVPVSVSYSKVLEEGLYAYELVGFPKPKESTSGLWKARSILDTDFGDVFIHFSTPISVREYFGKAMLAGDNAARLAHQIHALGPKSHFQVHPEEKNSIRTLAHSMVKIHQQHSIVSFWSLLCIAINQILARNGSDEIEIEYLLAEAGSLYEMVSKMGGYVRLRTNSLHDELNYNLKLHSNLIQVVNSQAIQLKPVSMSAVSTADRLPGKLVDLTVPRIIVSNYSNQGLHLFVEPAIVAVILMSNPEQFSHKWFVSQSLSAEFDFIQSLLARDFVFVPGTQETNLNATLNRLCQAGMMSAQESRSEGVDVHPDSKQHFYNIANGKGLSHVSQIIQPFLLGYWSMTTVLLQHGAENTAVTLGLGAVVNLVQLFISHNLLPSERESSNAHQNSFPYRYYQVLSSDLLKNAFHSLLDLQAITKAKGGAVHYNVDVKQLSRVKVEIEKFLSLVPLHSGAHMKAKL